MFLLKWFKENPRWKENLKKDDSTFLSYTDFIHTNVFFINWRSNLGECYRFKFIRLVFYSTKMATWNIMITWQLASRINWNNCRLNHLIRFHKKLRVTHHRFHFIKACAKKCASELHRRNKNFFTNVTKNTSQYSNSTYTGWGDLPDKVVLS